MVAISNIIALAASIMAVAAETTTSTTVLYQTVTITQCNPTNTACPLYTPTTTSTTSTTSTSSSSSSVVPTTSSVYYPASNTTSTVGPTAVYTNGTYPITSTKPATLTSYATVPATKPAVTPSATPSVPATGGAGALAVKSSLLLGVVGFGVALLG